MFVFLFLFFLFFSLFSLFSSFFSFFSLFFHTLSFSPFSFSLCLLFIFSSIFFPSNSPSPQLDEDAFPESKKPRKQTNKFLKKKNIQKIKDLGLAFIQNRSSTSPSSLQGIDEEKVGKHQNEGEIKMLLECVIGIALLSDKRTEVRIFVFVFVYFLIFLLFLYFFILFLYFFISFFISFFPYFFISLFPS